MNLIIEENGLLKRPHGGAILITQVNLLPSRYRDMKNMHFDVSFITGAGADATFGFSNGTDEIATFQRTVIANIHKNILVLPSAKVGFKALIKVCDVNQFNVLITD